MILKVDCSIEKGTHWANSMTFAEECTNEFISFDIDASFLVTLASLKVVRVKITDKVNNDLLFDETIDLTKNLDNIRMENMMHHGFWFKYKGLDL